MSLKKILLFAVIVLCAAGIFFSTGIHKRFSGEETTTAESGSFQKNPALDTTIGEPDEKEIAVLDEKEIDISYDASYKDTIKDILRQKKKYARQYQELVDVIRSLTQDKASELYGCGEVYVSAEPVFGYDAYAGKINYQTPQLLIFSKDYKKMAVCRFSWEGAANFGNADEELKNIISENSDDSIISIYGHRNEYWLKSDNIVHQGGRPEIEVKGNVYEIFKNSEIALNQEKILQGEKIRISISGTR